MKFRILVLLMCFLAVSAFGQEQATDQSQQNFVFITMVKGRVLLQEEQAQQDQYILKGDWLLTEKGARAEIRFGEQGGYLAIDENSKLFFVELSPEKSVIALFQGTAYLRHLEGVELRASGKPEGKIVLPQEDQIIRVDIVGDNVKVENDPDVRDSFDSLNTKREKETNSEVAKSVERQSAAVICSDYYPYSYYWNYWRWYGLCFYWYPGWYPMYYHFYNYGYYYDYYQNQYGYYGQGGNYQNYSGRQVVSRNQLQDRHTTVRPSRLNSFGNFISSARASIKTYPSRISGSSIRPSRTFSSTSIRPTIRPVRQSSTSSFGSSSSAPRIQSRPMSSYRSLAPTSSRGTTVSRSSSSSTSRSVSRGSVRRN
jgi:hypothetical protein